jgi:PAS domain S-box-containing protein
MRASDGAGWERLFWLVFGRTSNPIALLDGDRRIVEVNDAAVALFGGSRADLVGRSMADSIRPDERGRAALEWRAFLHSGEYQGRRVLVRPDGSEAEVDFAARLAEVGGEKMAIYVAMARPDPLSRVGRGGSQLAGDLPLTTREREVVTLIALGYETAEIAAQLHITPETVRTHVRNAMGRVGAHTRAQLVAIAVCPEGLELTHLEGAPS